MAGFEGYLTAALTKKHVPLIVVADKEKADYVITGNMMQRPEQPISRITSLLNSHGRYKTTRRERSVVLYWENFT